tara:strand:- start:622 stop:1098 length:477 start_codon:yes stop_codon:yes gene_type:complete
MARLNITRTLYTLVFSLVLTTGLVGCDDATEEAKQTPSDLRQKMMRDKLQKKNMGKAELRLLSFNIQHNKKSITLDDGDRDKILRIAGSLCNIDRTAGTTSSETYKTKIAELTGQLADLGYEIVSIKIIKGNDEMASQRQEIDIQIKNQQSSVNCSVY